MNFVIGFELRNIGFCQQKQWQTATRENQSVRVVTELQDISMSRHS